MLGILPGPDTQGEPLEVGRTDGSRAEAYRALAFRLRGGDGPAAVGTLMVVAPKRERGAEAVAVNLAAALAESGERVLLVDATGHTPGLPARLPLTADESVPSDMPAGAVIVDAGTAGRFTLRPEAPGTAADDGPAAPIAARALSGVDPERATLVLAPSLLEHTESLALAQRVDGVVVVADLGESRRDDLRRVRELIGCSGGRIVGAALHDGARRGWPARVLDSDLARRVRRRASSPAPSAPGEAVEKPTAPVRDDTLTASR